MFLSRVEKEIQNHQLLHDSMTVLIGVSGGPDSMALLSVLHHLSEKYCLKLVVVHVDHQLRQDSEKDQLYVQNYCKERHITCEVKKVNVRAKIEEEGGNIQAAARHLRYEAFEEVARHHQADVLALAHHMDDQVETVLMRIIRGTGLTGLIGMQVKKMWKGIQLIRPFLAFSKKELENYCRQEKLIPRIDSSNFSLDYTRNRIRLELFPILNTYNPKFKEAIFKLSEMVKEEDVFWDKHVKRGVEDVLLSNNDKEIILHTPSLLKMSVALQRRTIKLLLNSLMKDWDISLISVEQVRKLALQKSPSGKVYLPGGYMAKRAYSTLHIFLFEVVDAYNGLGVCELPSEGVVTCPGMRGKIKVTQLDHLVDCERDCTDHAIFDYLLLQLPLRVRSRRNGDRMTCFGMNGSKKVKKVFIEGKVPLDLRSNYPLVVDNKENILWIPGVKRSNHAVVNPNTKNFVSLCWIEDEIK